MVRQTATVYGCSGAGTPGGLSARGTQQMNIAGTEARRYS
jgi:hypothetical protein